MAKGNIDIDIKTKYSGEGFKKLDNDLKNASRGLQSTQQVIQQVTSKLGEMETGTSKALSTVGSLLTSFTKMGVVSAIIGGIASAWQLVSQYMEKAKKGAEEYSEILKGRVLQNMKDLNKAADKRDEELKDSNNSLNFINDTTKQDIEINRLKEIRKLHESHEQKREDMTDYVAIEKDKAKEELELSRLKNKYNVISAQSDKTTITAELDLFAENRRKKNEDLQRQYAYLEELKKNSSSELEKKSSLETQRDNLIEKINQVKQLKPNTDRVRQYMMRGLSNNQVWTGEQSIIAYEKQLHDVNEELKEIANSDTWKKLQEANAEYEKTAKELKETDKEFQDLTRKQEIAQKKIDTAIQTGLNEDQKAVEQFYNKVKQIELKGIDDRFKKIQEANKKEADAQKAKADLDKKYQQEMMEIIGLKSPYDPEAALNPFKYHNPNSPNNGSTTIVSPLRELDWDLNKSASENIGDMRRKEDARAVRDNSDRLRMENNNRNIKILEDRLFDRNGNIRKSASQADFDRLNQLQLDNNALGDRIKSGDTTSDDVKAIKETINKISTIMDAMSGV